MLGVYSWKGVIDLKKWLFFFISAIILVGCSQTTRAPANGQNEHMKSKNVTVGHRGIENIERLNQFVKSVKAKKPYDVRIIRFTTEGDPIYELLKYDGNNLNYTIDNTHDSYSSSDSRKQTTYKCKEINREETNTYTKYTLEGCPALQNNNLLLINHDIHKEDYFAFRLSYGKYNVIDTKGMRISKSLSNGTGVSVSDFRLKDSVMNDIYKAMIFSNYMGEKHFSNQCHSQSTTNYKLTVWINSGERNFKWGACDQSPDGKEMTQLAQYIIKTVENTHFYREMMK